MAEKKLSKLKFCIKTHSLINHFIMKYKAPSITKNFFGKDDKKYLCEKFKLIFGKYPDLENPRTFNEKICWEKLFWRSDLAKKCADKLESRSYIENLGLGRYLNEVYGVYDSAKDIDWSKIPNEFVIKTTNDSGSVFICHNKNNKEELSKIINKIDAAMHSKPYLQELEWVYEGTPRKIFIEKYLRNKDGSDVVDYKFHCFNGKVKCLYVASDRNVDVRYDYFTPSWEHMDDVLTEHLHAKKTPEKPQNFDEMIKLASLLSLGFPYVRIDMYNVDGQIIMGEMTFFHGAGCIRFYPSAFDNWLGDDFNLSIIPKNQLVEKKGRFADGAK
jgi:hypothetical protein